MRFLKINQLFYGVLMLALAASCSETAFDEAVPSQPVADRQPILLSVGNLVDVNAEAGDVTRSTNPNLQNNAFLPGTEVGLFVLHEERYRALMESINNDVMPTDLSDGTDYPEYMNVRARIQADGSVVVTDGTEMYYPMRREEKVALLAYTPYNPTYSILNLLTGFRVAVQTDQSTEKKQVASDFTLGMPVVGNPFRQKGAVAVGFKHLFTRVDLSLEVEPSEELLCESVEVKMTDVRHSYTINLLKMLQSSQSGVWAGTSSARGNVTFATMPAWEKHDIVTSPYDLLQLQCCAVLVPDQTRKQHPGRSAFEITLKGRLNGRADTTIVRVDTVNTDFLPGQSVGYKIRIAGKEQCPTEGEAVDLGLSVKWASRNVGATCPQEYGEYYAWGETEEKAVYNESTYAYYDSNTGYIDIGDNISGTQYDVARVKWGGKWRMPTLDEMEELFNKCTWEWTTYKGVNGYWITGPNGNSIFLSAAGYRCDEYLFNEGSLGYYWSGSLSSDFENFACSLFFYSGDRYWCYNDRERGHMVRPVTE